MSFPFLPKLRASGCGDPGAAIPFGCMFGGAQYLYRTAVAPASGTRLWLYAEVRRHKLGAQEHIFAAASGNNVFTIGWDTSDRFGVNQGVAGSSTTGYAYTDRVFRDPARSYSVLVDIDTSRATASERLRLWINGERQAWSAGASFLAQGTILWAHPAGYQQRLGGGTSSYYGATYSNLTLSRFACGDGVADIDVGAFGYVNRFGVWVPRVMPAPASLPLGNNGCVLDFALPLDLGHDVSGKANHWTASGLTAANQVTDTPTHGYPTYTPLEINSTMTLSDGNLTALKTGSYGSAMASILLPTFGKWYWAGKLVSGYDNYIGIARALPGSGAYIGGTADGYAYRSYAGASYKVHGGTLTAYAAAAASGAEVGVCYDADAGTLRFAINGVLYDIAFSGITGRWYPAVSNQWTNAATGWTLNFGQRAFAYAPPAGYKPLSTLNLPCPAIKRPERYITTRLRSAGAAVADLPWSPLEIKTLVLSKRLDGYDWRANDTLRPGRAWAANLTTGDFAEADGLTLTPTGYTIGAAAAYAGSRIDYIWRASAAAGFDILLVDHVTGAPTTVPHGAGRLIDFALVVPVGVGGQRRVYHRGLAAGQYLTLSGSSGTDSGWFASTALDVTLGAAMPTGKYTLYVWGAVPGFSSFPTYVGTGGNPGPFSLADFAPAIALYQGIGKQPFIRDVAQNPTNPVSNQLNLCLAAALSTTDGDMDFVSNGIARRASSANWNTSGVLHALAMWAGTPGKFTRAR